MVLRINMGLPQTRGQRRFRACLLLGHGQPGIIARQRGPECGGCAWLGIVERQKISLVVRLRGRRRGWLVLYSRVLAAPGGHRGPGEHSPANGAQDSRVDAPLFQKTDLCLGGMNIYIDLPGINSDIHYTDWMASRSQK